MGTKQGLMWTFRCSRVVRSAKSCWRSSHILGQRRHRWSERHSLWTGTKCPPTKHLSSVGTFTSALVATKIPQRASFQTCELARIDSDYATHLLNGMFFEVYFNHAGRPRGNQLK